MSLAAVRYLLDQVDPNEAQGANAGENAQANAIGAGQGQQPEVADAAEQTH